jgi:hypothetical protein
MVSFSFDANPGKKGQGVTLSGTNGGSVVFDGSGKPTKGFKLLDNGDDTVVFFNVVTGAITITLTDAAACTVVQAMAGTLIKLNTLMQVEVKCK